MALRAQQNVPSIPVLASDVDEGTLEASLRAQTDLGAMVERATQARTAILALLDERGGQMLPPALHARLVQDQVLLAGYLHDLEAAQYVHKEVRTDLAFLHAALDLPHVDELES